MARRFAPVLLRWYDAHRRDLPWRRDTDPYRVWVAEVMLQQTRVDAVLPYYERWLRRFPSLSSLAAARLDDVLKEWEGLGYYRRARNLHRAARLVRDRHGGGVPADPAVLRRLPGIGEYTAGAIASIAFGVPAPAVDGNARRVLCRVFDLPDPRPAELRAAAAGLVPEDRPGDFNQALMELGARVCTPVAPACGACPVAGDCLGRRRGTVACRPRAAPRRAVQECDIGTAVVRAADGRMLLVRRPDHGLLAGLWEFPGAAARSGEATAAAAARAAADWIGTGEAGRVPNARLGVVAHAFTHRKARYDAFLFHARPRPAATARDGSGKHVREAAPAGHFAVRLGQPARRDQIRWVTAEEAEALAMPVAQRKILRLAAAHADGGA